MAREHDNDVFFAIAGLKSFSFQPTSDSITDGQPYSGATGSVDDGKAKIEVKAGRKGSSSVAQWFRTQVGDGQTIVCDTAGTFPDELNFAVMGNMTIETDSATYTCNDVIVAQGNFGSTNNWWMGSSHWQGVHISISGVAFQKVDTTAPGRLPTIGVFSPQTPCVNNFSISFIDVNELR